MPTSTFLFAPNSLWTTATPSNHSDPFTESSVIYGKKTPLQHLKNTACCMIFLDLAHWGLYPTFVSMTWTITVTFYHSWCSFHLHSRALILTFPSMQVLPVPVGHRLPKYQVALAKVAQENPGTTNERFVWHGTHGKSANSIVKQGFRIDLAGTACGENFRIHNQLQSLSCGIFATQRIKWMARPIL